MGEILEDNDLKHIVKAVLKSRRENKMNVLEW